MLLCIEFCYTPFHKAEKKCVFQVSGLKKLGMVGRHNILFCQNIYIEIAFLIHFPPFSNKLDNILLTIHNKMFRVGTKT